jgi:hypothetical protein
MTFPWPLTTDQKQCYDARGQTIACPGSGQDAAGGISGHRAGPRFLLGGEVVADRLTGLRWSRDANPFDFPYTWPEAFALLADMNRDAAHGIDEWRLPSRRELFSLVSHQHVNPALPGGHPFHNVFPGYYWTSQTCTRLPEQAWYIHLGGARVYRGMKNGAYLVWPVAGPRRVDPTAEDRFEIERDVVHDRQSGLRWSCGAGCSAAPCTWEDALAAAVEHSRTRAGGLTTWRLPNIRELESLVDLTRHSPALAPGLPGHAAAEGCWSATTSVYEPRYAWVLYLRDGAVGVGFKPEATFCAWLVAGRPTSPGTDT